MFDKLMRALLALLIIAAGLTFAAFSFWVFTLVIDSLMISFACLIGGFVSLSVACAGIDILIRGER